MECCVLEATKSGDEEERRKKLDEIAAVLDKLAR